MKSNALEIILKILLSIILILPILGATGVFPPPTPDLYNTPEAFAFIIALMGSMYINYMMSVVHIIALIALWSRREALAALLITPITANIVAFQLFLDGGLFTGGAFLGNLMLLINIYFLYKYRDAYRNILESRNA